MQTMKTVVGALVFQCLCMQSCRAFAVFPTHQRHHVVHQPPPRLQVTHQMMAKRSRGDRGNWLPKLPSAGSLWKRLQTSLSNISVFRSKEKQQPKQDSIASKTSSTSSEEQNLTTSTAVEQPQDCRRPFGSRWAVAANDVDLSGEWKPIISPTFRQKYDHYLKSCGENVWFRQALLAVIGMGREVYRQEDQGRVLSITGLSPVAQWERRLVASGTDQANQASFESIHTVFRDPDGDTVQVEAWWANEGTVHTSMLRGKPRVLGGAFQSKRYLDPADSNILICESTFFPPDSYMDGAKKFQQDEVVWRFERVS